MHARWVSACAVVVGLGVGAATRADAAQLEITGPPGARAKVDGHDVGTLPLGPIPITTGSHDVELELAGYHSQTMTVRTSSDEESVHLRFDLDHMSRRHAAMTSVLVAGAGQRSFGRPWLGWTLTAAEAGGITAGILGEVKLRDEKDKWQAAYDRYHAAIDPDEIAAARGEVEAAEAAMDDAEKLRNIGIGVAVGAVAVSVLDVLIRGPKSSPPAAAQAAAGGDVRSAPDFGVNDAVHFAQIPIPDPRLMLQPAFGPGPLVGCAVQARF